ncbi:MAG: Nre family DNA repair protein [Candidatus Nezhaarchaeota archaeon]|nr:Nre family DNA repair protein [Candidatus Nezhaarchaeota archaeon]
MDRPRKFVKLVKRRIPWLEHVIESEADARDLDPGEGLLAKVPRRSPCVQCKASRMLCGKPSCPIILRLRSYVKLAPKLSELRLYGSSPPALFVGRHGYPYVNIGPLVPPTLGDTSLLDSPEEWLGRGLGLEDLVDMRIKLFRGKHRAHVKEASDPKDIVAAVQELAMSRSSVDAEVEFAKRPIASLILDDEVQPMGPSGTMSRLTIGSTPTHSSLEAVCADLDLAAEEALMKLYLDGVPVSQIQRAFSSGIMGVKARRKLVPTRWSITAVDSLISRRLRDEIVKKSPEINEYRVYTLEVLGNIFLVLMMPGRWSYESIEAWYPGSAWNPDAESLAFCGDWEPYWGRTTYASMGGCYYAARLAVVEALSRERRQAQVLVLREARPSYLMPMGVWIVREAVRRALGGKPAVFNTAEEALAYVPSRLKISLAEWIKVSRLLSDLKRQEKITKYL